MVHALEKLTTQKCVKIQLQNYDHNTWCGKCNKVRKKQLKEDVWPRAWADNSGGHGDLCPLSELLSSRREFITP